MKTQRIHAVGIGEVLMDEFESGEVAVGGAPLNVTFQLHQLFSLLGSGKASIVSRVGKDKYGEQILAQLHVSGLDIGFVSVDANHTTGTARVHETAGQPGFEIAPDVAWDFISATPALDTLAREAQAVSFGSLAQRSEVSRETIHQFVAKVNGTRLYDVNLRRNRTNSVAGYSDAIVRESLSLATVVKLNDDELETLAAMLALHVPYTTEPDRQWSLLEELQQSYELSIIALTRGSKGPMVLGKGERRQLADSRIRQDSVHPVGAGDAFSAGLLFGIVSGWSLSCTVDLAELLSSWSVTHVGASPTFSPLVVAKILDLANHA